MDQWFDVVSSYATKETMTVIGALATAWLGWKLTRKTVGVVSRLTGSLSTYGLLAILLSVGGLGTTGFGLGDLVSRTGDTPEGRLTNADLLALANASNDHTANQILEFERQRNGLPAVENQLTQQQKLERVKELVFDSSKDEWEALAEIEKTLEANKQTETSVRLVSYPGSQPESVLDANSGAGKKEETDALLSLQAAWAMVFVGLGGLVSGICIAAKHCDG